MDNILVDLLICIAVWVILGILISPFFAHLLKGKTMEIGENNGEREKEKNGNDD